MLFVARALTAVHSCSSHPLQPPTALPSLLSFTGARKAGGGNPADISPLSSPPCRCIGQQTVTACTNSSHASLLRCERLHLRLLHFLCQRRYIMTTANKRRRVQPIPLQQQQQQQQQHSDAASPQLHAAAATASVVPPLLSLKSALHFPFPPPAPPSPPSAALPSQDAPPRLTPLSPVLSTPPSALSSLPASSPPRPAAAAPAAINFDVPFTLLDDDIAQFPELATAAVPTSASGRRKQHRRKGGSGTAQQKQAAAADVSVVRSSLPGSPSTPSTSAPTAVTTPVNSAVTATALLQAAGESSNRLMRQLELLSGQQKETREDDAAEPAGKGSSNGRRKKPAASAPRAAGTAKKSVKASPVSAKFSHSGSEAASPRRRGSPYIDTSNAQDIRAFLPAPLPLPSHQLHTQPQSVTASVRPAVPVAPASAVPASSSWTAVSSLSSSLWSPAAEVDIAALRQRFNLGKGAGEQSTAAISQAMTAAESEREETDSQPAASRKRGGKAAKAPRQSAATRSRTRREQQQEQITAATQPGLATDSRAVMAEIVPETTTTLSSSSSSMLPPSAASASESEAIGEPTSAEPAGDEQVQPLERAKTVVAINNTAELEPRETPPLPSASFVLPLPRVSSSSDPPTPQQQTEAERAAQRQMSLASNSSSSSTASMVSSRLQSPELPSGLLPPFACESLPCTFRDYAVKHLQCSLSLLPVSQLLRRHHSRQRSRRQPGRLCAVVHAGCSRGRQGGAGGRAGSIRRPRQPGRQRCPSLR